MPIYEYACKSCNFQKDVLQKLNDAPLTKCPECGLETFTKKVSAAAFRLKGSGWYETDFKTGTKKNIAEDSAAPASNPESAPSAGGEPSAGGKPSAGGEPSASGKPAAEGKPAAGEKPSGSEKSSSSDPSPSLASAKSSTSANV